LDHGRRKTRPRQARLDASLLATLITIPLNCARSDTSHLIREPGEGEDKRGKEGGRHKTVLRFDALTVTAKYVDIELEMDRASGPFLDLRKGIWTLGTFFGFCPLGKR
jgi:hypothetical protein